MGNAVRASASMLERSSKTDVFRRVRLPPLAESAITHSRPSRLHRRHGGLPGSPVLSLHKASAGKLHLKQCAEIIQIAPRFSASTMHAGAICALSAFVRLTSYCRHSFPTSRNSQGKGREGKGSDGVGREGRSSSFMVKTPLVVL